MYCLSANNKGYSRQTLLPWLICPTRCTICSIACFIISSNCCAWNVWNCFIWLSSAFNILKSPRSVEARTSSTLLSLTRPGNKLQYFIINGTMQQENNLKKAKKIDASSQVFLNHSWFLYFLSNDQTITIFQCNISQQC